MGWYGDTATVDRGAPDEGPAPCTRVARKRGVWWWVYRFPRPADNTCETCRNWSGLITALESPFDENPERVELRPPYRGWCGAMRDYTKATDGPWSESFDDGCRWEAFESEGAVERAER